MEITTERPAATGATVRQRARSTTATVIAGRTPLAVGAARSGAALDAAYLDGGRFPVGARRSGTMPTTTPATTPVTPTRGVRVLLIAFCCLTAAAVVSLLVRADRTAETFAWTIEPSVSAGFLGSAYAAGFVLSVLAVRSRDWRVVRVPFLTVLVFVWLTAGATFYHLHRLHVQAPGDGPLGQVAAWLWLAVYVAVPVAMTVLLPRQPHVAGWVHGRAPVAPLPRPLTAVLVAQGVVLAVAGAALLVRCLSSHGMPADRGRHGAHGNLDVAQAAMATPAEPLWPWTLSPLAAGVIGAWLLAFAVAVGLCVADGDLTRLRIATRAYTAFGALELLNVLRFRDQVAWADPTAWIFVATAVAVTVTGAAGWVLARRAMGPRQMCADAAGFPRSCRNAVSRGVVVSPSLASAGRDRVRPRGRLG